MPRSRIHMLRHAFTSYMANNGVPAFIVAKMLGHGSLAIVMTYYHASDAELCDSVKALDLGGMLSEPKTGPTDGSERSANESAPQAA